MSALLHAAAAGLPLAGWSAHGLWLHARLSAARCDPLSGLWTRAAFEHRAARLLARRQGRPVLVVMVDLDGFKHLNDRFGHAAGDAAIRATAASLRDATDASSASGGVVLARLGGDEFAAAIALPGPAAVPWLLGGLHKEVTAPFRHAGRDLTVGASIGASLTTDLVPEERVLPVLLRLADEAMYAAKRAGGGWHYPGATAPAAATAGGRRAGRAGASAGASAGGGCG
ncbi:GGDEF domain-containing protein [Streptomyces sp. MNP-20]|uniref:GGDEF domain-containing protein n=1 Tax=Streptomyces sp. MNP-20 TaxID=2721165 RepID=UPI001551B83F|nr:GGDEF domain-containing protein [Streptomyces sp. MNP-20]